MPPNVRPAVPHPPWAPEDERLLCEAVMAKVEAFDSGLGPDFRENCIKYYKQYRGFRNLRDAWTRSGPNDKDGLLYDAKRHWGAQLHIPLSFRTIEQKVPRAIAHRPKLLYFPRQERHAENVKNIRLLIDAQQDNIDIDLPFQAVMRSGHIYGIGIGKCYWRKEYAKRRKVQRAMRPLKGREWTVGDPKQECTFDDPYFEDVDPFDFMWDPYAADTKTAEWVVHRIWMSLETCLDRVRSQAWNTVGAQMLDEEKLRAMAASGQRYDEVWQDRMEASGFGSQSFSTRGEQIHELLEFHDGENVVTVLDRCLVVQDRDSPCMGKIPFQVYRPTPLQKQMVGIGDLEPVAHLQRELDTLRSQARDSVTLALAGGFIFDDGAIDEEDLVWGPNAAIRVTNADVRSAIMPVPQPNIPAGAWQLESSIRQDMDVVPGISDSMDPSTSSAQTATEAQIVQASLSARIALASRRFEIEVVRDVAKCWLYLNQRMITRDRPPIPIPEDESMSYEDAAEEGRWRWFQVGPGELQGEVEIVPEGGSMAAKNIPQDRQDGQFFFQLAQNPLIDRRRALMKALELYGIRDGEAWLEPAEKPVPPATLQALSRAGVPKDLIDYAVMVGQQEDPALAQTGPEGPNVQQMDQLMGVQGG